MHAHPPTRPAAPLLQHGGHSRADRVRAFCGACRASPRTHPEPGPLTRPPAPSSPSPAAFVVPAATPSKLPSSKVATAPRMTAVVDEVVDKLKGMTLLEASELVKAIEETFDVSAAGGGGMVMAAAPAAGGDGGGEAAAAKDEFDVVLESFPADKKIAVLKVVRSITGLGLKEAKEFVESAPKAVKEGASKSDCEDVVKQITDAGGVAAMK